MQPLLRLAIKSIQWTTWLDCRKIMDHWMNLRNVEIITYSRGNKDGLAFMEGFKCFLERLQSQRGVYFKLWIINEINDYHSCVKYCRLNRSNEKASENLQHLFMLMASPLWNKQNPVFEVLEAWVSWRTAELCVNLVSSSNLKTPTDKMIFEDTFVELMKNVGGKTNKDIGMWKVCPNGL